MPHLWELNMLKVAVSVEELIPTYFASINTLKSHMARGQHKTSGIRRLQRACYGKPMLLDYDTLPKQIQVSLCDPRRCQHIFEGWFTLDKDAVRFYANYTFDNGTTLSFAHQHQYILNASVLQAARSYKNALEQQRRRGTKVNTSFYHLNNQSQLFQQTLVSKLGGKPHTLPTSGRRFTITYQNFFCKDGCNYGSLISGKLTNENASKRTAALTGLLDSLFARAGTKPNKRSVSSKYQAFLEGTLEVFNNQTGELYDRSAFQPLSLRSITRWLSGWESKAGTLSLRSGDRQRLLGQTSVSAVMNKPVYAGSLISVDDRQPPFEYGPGQRLWLYNCLDVASDAITVTVWGKSKEGMILDFYRELVRKYTQWGVRLPAELEAESSLNSSFKETFLRPGVLFEHVRLEANNARSKIIERRNRDFRLCYEKELDGWKGRPFARDESNQALPTDTLYSKGKFVPYEQLVQQSLSVVVQWNNSLHPNQQQFPGKTRWDYFMSMQNKELPPTNWRAFMPYLGYSVKSSCQVGKIRLQGQYMFLGEQGSVLFGAPLIDRLKRIEGQQVTVYWLDNSEGDILKALVYLGDSYVCEAIPAPRFQRAKVERTEQDEVNLKIQSRYIATVAGYIKARKTSIEAVTVVDNRPKMVNDHFSFPHMQPRAAVNTEDDLRLPQVPDDLYVSANHTPYTTPPLSERW